MDQPPQKKRLDEILIELDLITENKIQEALSFQKIEGGKIGSQLLYHQFIDEAGLVKALSVQQGCKGVILTGVTIHDMVLKMIPKKVVISRKVVPFDYDPENNILKIACINPHQANLADELGFIARGKKILLFISVEIVLNSCIAKYYMGRDISGDSNYLLELPIEVEELKQELTESEKHSPQQSQDNFPAIMMVTDDSETAPLLTTIFEKDGYRITVTDSANEAIGLLGEKIFHTIFIKDTVAGDYIDLIERARKISPGTTVRYYDTTSSLLLHKDAVSTEAEILIQNLELFTSLLASKDEQKINHSGQVGKYVDKLCRKLNLPDKERLMISTAAYVHDVARHYYNANRVKNPRDIISMTVKLLTSLNYSPVITEILRTMYFNLRGKYTKRLPIEVLGGNILTIIDLFCDSNPMEDSLSIDKFEVIKKRIDDQIGQLFLPEVVEAFVAMINEELFESIPEEQASQVLIYAEDLSIQQPLEMRLRYEGLRTVSHNTIQPFIELYHRSKPDIMVLVATGTPDSAMRFVDELKDSGINFEEIPTFLLTEAVCVSRLTHLLEQGIDDIIPYNDSLNLLTSKTRKLKIKLEQEARATGKVKQTAAAQGQLSDMNLMNLLQAMGPGQKTVKITVHRESPKKSSLVIFLDKGKVVHAAGDKLTGAEAVYDGLTWTEGYWTVEPASSENIPEPNNTLPNKAILMEACRMMDEKDRSGDTKILQN